MDAETVGEGGVAVSGDDVGTRLHVVEVDSGNETWVLDHGPSRPEFSRTRSTAVDQLLAHASIEQCRHDPSGGPAPPMSVEGDTRRGG